MYPMLWGTLGRHVAVMLYFNLDLKKFVGFFVFVFIKALIAFAPNLWDATNGPESSF